MKNVLQKLILQAGMSAFVGLIAGVWVATASAATAQSPSTSIRLYVLDCGTNLKRDPAREGLPGAPADKHTPCFLVVHPKGTLLWENGLNDARNDRPGGGMEPGGPAIVTKSLWSQLVEIGHPPATITYVAISHYHSDHSGNSNDYAGSTWLTQKDQHDAMFGPWPGVLKAPLPNAWEWSALKNSKTVIIDNKDYDVFGDGSVVILYTPADTPGHQSLFVKLPKTGPVVISGDLYTESVAHRLYLQMTGHETVGTPFSQAEIDKFQHHDSARQIASMDKIENFLTKTGAQLWIQHDLATYNSLKKAPAYYD